MGRKQAAANYQRVPIRTLYRRSQFLYLYTYPTLLWLAGFIAVLYYPPLMIGPAIALFLLFAIFFYGAGIQQYHFALTPDALLVSNHWFLWKHHRFEWKDVKEVRFLSELKSAGSKGIPWEAGISVRTDDNDYSFRAGALKESDLQELVTSVNIIRREKSYGAQGVEVIPRQ